MLLQRSSELVCATLNSALQARWWIHINKWWPLKAKPWGSPLIWPPRWMSPRPKWIKGQFLYDVMLYQLRIWCDYTVCWHHCVLCFSDLFKKKKTLLSEISNRESFYSHSIPHRHHWAMWLAVPHDWKKERPSHWLETTALFISFLTSDREVKFSKDEKTDKINHSSDFMPLFFLKCCQCTQLITKAPFNTCVNQTVMEEKTTLTAVKKRAGTPNGTVPKSFGFLSCIHLEGAHRRAGPRQKQKQTNKKLKRGLDISSIYHI